METHYAFREKVGQRLLTPMSDPMVYEYPADQIFDSPEEAQDFADEVYPDESVGWVIVKVTIEEVVEIA